jgi:hypothetical protein
VIADIQSLSEKGLDPLEGDASWWVLLPRRSGSDLFSDGPLFGSEVNHPTTRVWGATDSIKMLSIDGFPPTNANIDRQVRFRCGGGAGMRSLTGRIASEPDGVRVAIWSMRSEGGRVNAATG